MSITLKSFCLKFGRPSLLLSETRQEGKEGRNLCDEEEFLLLVVTVKSRVQSGNESSRDKGF